MCLFHWQSQNTCLMSNASRARALSIVNTLLSNSNIKLSNESLLVEKLKRFVEGGRSQIAVVTDFGRTVTTGASLSTHAIVQKCISCPTFHEESKENDDSVSVAKKTLLLYNTPPRPILTQKTLIPVPPSSSVLPHKERSKHPAVHQDPPDARMVQQNPHPHGLGRHHEDHGKGRDSPEVGGRL